MKMTRNAMASRLQHGIQMRASALMAQPPASIASSIRVRALVNEADDAIRAGELETFLRLYESLGVSPPVEAIEEFAEQALLGGHLEEALFAYAITGGAPDEYYLDQCATVAAGRNAPQASRARYLARQASRRFDSGVGKAIATLLKEVK